VPPIPRVPLELTRRAFSLQEARAAGITRTSLRGKSWRRIGTELYCWSGLDLDQWKLLAGWQRLLPHDAVFAGSTAAWLHGIDNDPLQMVEVIARPSSGLRSRNRLNVRRCALRSSDVVRVRGLPATSVNRTLTDLCLRLPEVEGLVAMDASLHLRLVDKGALSCLRGRRLQYLAMLAEPAESPMETRLRWLLLKSGLPSPKVQVDLRDADGRFIGRADLYYSVARLVIEYDGASHRERLAEDNRRQNNLVDAGFRVLRFAAADLRQRPATVVALVRNALGTAHI